MGTNGNEDNKKIYNKALETSKFVCADATTKADIFAKYSLLADASENGSNMDIIRNNIDTFKPLMSMNVIRWVLTEKGKPLYAKAVQSNINLAKLFSSEAVAVYKMQELSKELSIEMRDESSFDDVCTKLKLFGIERADGVDTEEVNTLDLESIDNIDIDFDDNLLTEYVDGVDSINISGIDENDIEIDENNEDEYELGEVNIQEDKPEEQLKVKESTVIEKKEETKTDSYDGYIEKVHKEYKDNILELLMRTWEDMYGYHVNGTETLDGFVVPGGAILGTGESIKYQGILALKMNKIEVIPNTMSDALFEEFFMACKKNGIPLIREIGDDVNVVKAYKYNPMLQRKIASGSIDKQAFLGGWKTYSKALEVFMDKIARKLAVRKAETGSDEEIYKELSGYTVSMAVVNYRQGLGTKLKISCGDTSKTMEVAKDFVEGLKAREKTHRSIAQGKLVVGAPILGENGLSAVIPIYTNMAGYQAVPDFMGELLCNLDEGMFKPSVDDMLIGLDLKNKMVKVPTTNWLVPIIAGSRSGKGVLTLNMLLNVIGSGAPLFYLDCKPDMASLLWGLQKKYGITNSMVVDGIGYEGITTIDGKEYKAPYAEVMKAQLKSEKANPILADNFGIMIYLKAMLAIELALEYYKDVLKTPYGKIFVVFDELYKAMTVQANTLMKAVDVESKKCDTKDTNTKKELNKIKFWAESILDLYRGNDIGVFGGGIRAVALTQFAQVGQYKADKFPAAETFCENFLLKRGIKLFGRQEGGAGPYGVNGGGPSDVNFKLYDSYFHFGIGKGTGLTYSDLKTFKPLLVLNENDCKEMTGKQEDGAFTRVMLERVARFADVNEFRKKYFDVKNNRELAESIGFEGALAQVGRLIGKDWREMLKLSIGRAYEITDEALRYYGVIGNGELNTVYDYICSLNTEHLWSGLEIKRKKAKGESLTGDEEVKSAFEEKDSDEELDFGGEIDFGDKTVSNQGYENSAFGAKVLNNEHSSYGGKTQQLSEEEQRLIEERELRKQAVSKVIHGGESNEEIEGVNQNNKNATFEENDNDNKDVENTQGEYERLDNQKQSEVEDNEDWENIKPTMVNAKPEETVTGNQEQVFNHGGKTGKKVFVNPTQYTTTFKMTPENSIIAELDDDHPLESKESKLFRNLRGAEYEFSKRWKVILDATSSRIKPSLVTRVMILKDEMYINGRLIVMKNIIGGFENIRLEDIVNFKELFKRFKNISELTLDSTMVERFSIEVTQLPQGLFVYSQKLLRVGIIFGNGTKEVIDRRDINANERANEELERAKYKNQFEAVCALKNPRLTEMSPGYQTNTWKAAKSFGSKSWQSISNDLTRENPKFLRATLLGTLTLGIMAMGGTIHGVKSLFGLFRR